MTDTDGRNGERAPSWRDVVMEALTPFFGMGAERAEATDAVLRAVMDEWFMKRNRHAARFGVAPEAVPGSVVWFISERQPTEADYQRARELAEELGLLDEPPIGSQDGAS